MSAHQNPAVPFNISGPDRVCDGACGREASFFLSHQRDHGTGLPILVQRWCGDCVPADWLPGRRRKAAAA